MADRIVQLSAVDANDVEDKLYPATFMDAVTDKSGKTLTATLNELRHEISLGTNQWYGIEWDTTVSNPKCKRIGNQLLHVSLPIQSKMRRCLLNDGGTVNYYLDRLDSLKKENGSAAILDGTDGQVMVELPAHYAKFESEGTVRRAKLSEYPLEGFHLIPKIYVSAYEAALERTSNKLSSVVNLTPAYRGGGNQSSWDELSKSQLGKPVTNIPLSDFRVYARNRGSINWNAYTYQAHRELFWLFVVEYANFDSQSPFNQSLTPDGYRQGGLGIGVTSLNTALWNNFNGYFPFVSCGHTNSLGDRTGNVDFVMPVEYGALTVIVPSYRGIENPFGHIWKWADGCKSMIQSDTDGGVSELYICNSPENFTSPGTANYELRGVLPRVAGYAKEVIIGEYGEIMPRMIGGSTTTYFCDYFYASNPTSGISERAILFGSSANNGLNAGLVSELTYNTVTSTSTYFGSRLCYIPTV